MDKKKFEELTQLYFLNELSDEKKLELENYMLEDDKARKEFESIRQLHSALISNRPAAVSEDNLYTMRDELLQTVRTIDSKISLTERITDWFSEVFIFNYRAAFGGIAALVVGIFIGYLSFGNFQNEKLIGHSLDDFNPEMIENDNFNIANIRFEESIGNEGQVEVSFDTFKPVKFKGSRDNRSIQLLLAKALLTSENPGIRLRTVNALSAQFAEPGLVDPKIKNAFITALKADENPAVRKEALLALSNFPYDNEIRDAILFTLTNDDNSGLRVTAINLLTDKNNQQKILDMEIKNVLRHKALSDENDFVKIRAASILKEEK